MQQKRFTIAENAPVALGTYRLRLAGDTAAITAPGQFADIRLAGYFLRRPVSVCSWSDGALTLYYKVAGAGTAKLSTLAPGTELDLLVGLGNGFDTAPAGARPLLVWRSSSWPRGAARWPCSAFARRRKCCLPMRFVRSASPSRS